MTAITKAVYDKMIASKKARNIDDASYYGYMYSVAPRLDILKSRPHKLQ